MTSRLKLLLRRFQKGENGAIAVIFALALIPLIAAVGAAVDGARLYMLHSELQSLADAATISAGADPFNNSKATLDAVVSRYINANKPSDSIARVVMRETTYDAEEQRYTLLLEGTMDTTFMKIINVDNLKVVVRAQILRALPGPIEIAMAIDFTTSMGFPLSAFTTCEADGSLITTRLQALRCGVLTIVDDLSTFVTANSTDKMMIGIVPFAQRVNVGTSNYGKFWLANSFPPNMWSGCVGYRNKANRRTIASLRSFQYPMVASGFTCPPASSTIVPLTKIWLQEDRNRLKSVLSVSVSSNGGASYVPSGLGWAWHLLDNAGADSIFTEGRTKAKLAEVKGRKVILLFTDGGNNTGPTTDLASTSLLASGRAEANAQQADLCNNIKADGIEIFVISFLRDLLPADQVSEEARLMSCASSPQHFFRTNSAEEIITAFRNVAVAFRPVQLTD